MKIKVITTESGEFIELASCTYDEESEIAHSVVDTLSKPWVNGEFRRTAERIYHRGTQGQSCSREELRQYMKELDFWIKEMYEVGKGHMAPYDPMFDPNTGKEMKAPNRTRSGETSNEWKSNWYANERRQAWRERWEEYKKPLCSYSDDYRTFPGDSNADLEDQELAQLPVFYEEVKKTQKAYRCSIDQAMREVMDRMPHADLSIDELHDLAKDYL